MGASQTIRSLVVRLALDARDAVRDLKAFDRLSKQVADNVERTADRIERAAGRISAGMRGLSQGARAAASPSGGGGRGGGAGRAKDPLAGPMASAGRTEARRAGLAAGSERVDSATKGLGALATASERAKAKVSDLSATVERNRREMAALREQAAKTGDASGTLAARAQGLAVATAKVNVELQAARRELRAVDGSLIDAVKSAGNLSGRFSALTVAAGNLISAGVSRGLSMIAGGIGAAAEKAIDFESAFADVKKVLPDNTSVQQVDALSESIVDLSRRVAVDGPEGAAKLTAALVQTGLYADEAGTLSEQALLRATEFAAKTAVAFDVTAGQAGEGLAKVQTSAGLTQEGIESLAGTINHLSNNMAAKAPELLDAAARVGGIGRAANLSAETTTALSAAMVAAGGTAETAATGTKNLTRTLAIGAAATRKQKEAFAALGVEAADVAKRFTAGGESAEATIRDIVKRLGTVAQEERLAVLAELFGADTMQTIGPLATNIELLGKAFRLAGDDAAALTSVQKEYDSRSKTTANAIQLLKNNVSALAIQFGEALLPHINRVVAFLTSPEGREWGQAAVARATEVVSTLASGLATVADVAATVVDKIGGVGAAVAAMGVAVGLAAGPWGLLAVAATTALAAIISKVADLLRDLPLIGDSITDVVGRTQALAKEIVDEQDRDKRLETHSSRIPVVTMGEGQLPAGAKITPEMTVPGLAAARAARDRAKRGVRGHKATEMDRRLAALDPSLAGVLRQGGARDAGGDLKVSGDVLSRAVYARATGTGSRDGASAGPGPNITTHNYFNQVTVNQAIDARSPDSSPANIRDSAGEAGRRVAEVVFTGQRKVVASRNAGGRMA